MSGDATRGFSWDGCVQNNSQIFEETVTVKSLVADHLLCNATVQTLNGNPFFCMYND